MKEIYPNNSGMLTKKEKVTLFYRLSRNIFNILRGFVTMSIKEIVFSMMAVMIAVFAIFPFYRKREVKRNNIEVKYFEALRSGDQNLFEIGMEYYQDLGLDEQSAKDSIESDKAHTKV